jgi:hypothetical protein
MTKDYTASKLCAAFDTHPRAETGAHFATFANEPIFCSPSPEGGVHQKAKPMINTASTPSLYAANDTVGTATATIAITGIVALLARSQARRLAEQSSPANDSCAPSDWKGRK